MKAIRVALLAALFAAGCAKSDRKSAQAEADKAPIADSHETSPSSPKPPDSRKVIRTGKIELVVATYEDARGKVDALVKDSGGYVDSTRVERHESAVSDATIVIRIPSASFDGVLPKLREIGEIVSETTNGADITDQFVDTEARLASDQQLETRLLELATARNGNLDQILAVERELARVRGEIESYQGHLKQWNDQVAMSTLTIDVSTRRSELPRSAPPTLGSQTSSAFHSSVQALRDLGEWFVINGVAFLPWLLVLIPGGLIARALLRRLRTRLQLPKAIVHEPPPAA
jgi:hypothetical protein